MKERLSFPAVLILLIPLVFIYFLSTSPSYRYFDEDDAGFLISFKKTTDRVHLCDDEELSRFKEAAKHRRKHMQKVDRICGSRERVPLKLKVWIDDKVVLDKKIMPSGVNQDSSTYVYQEFIFPKGKHKIRIAMKGSRGDDPEFDYFFEDTILFSSRQRTVVDFDTVEEKFYLA